ncbi:MAG: hypothetical protein IT290_00910 [Deltaproteobacteria bacterium]|nr:hypothetical protein [Deltaproteobacteria bacterium]
MSQKRASAGQALSEVIIVVVLIAIVALVAIRTLGRSVNCQYGEAQSSIDTLRRGSSGCEPQMVAQYAYRAEGGGREEDPPVSVWTPRPTPLFIPPLPPPPMPTPRVATTTTTRRVTTTTTTTRRPTTTTTRRPTTTTVPTCSLNGGACGYVARSWSFLPEFLPVCRMPRDVEPANCNRCCTGRFPNGQQVFGYRCGKRAGDACHCY